MSSKALDARRSVGMLPSAFLAWVKRHRLWWSGPRPAHGGPPSRPAGRLGPAPPPLSTPAPPSVAEPGPVSSALTGPGVSPWAFAIGLPRGRDAARCSSLAAQSPARSATITTTPTCSTAGPAHWPEASTRPVPAPPPASRSLLLLVVWPQAPPQGPGHKVPSRADWPKAAGRRGLEAG